MTAGVVLIVIGGLSAVTLCALWRFVPLVPAVLGMAIAASLLAAGELLIQDGVTTAEWVVAIVVFAVLAPVQAHLVLSDRGGTVAADGPAA